MNIKEYLSPSGVSPFRKWYKKLDSTVQIKVDARLQRIKILANFGDKKSIGDGLLELRFRSSIRIYYARNGRNIILLLVGGNKSSQSKDIKKANEYWHDYKIRGIKNGK